MDTRHKKRLHVDVDTNLVLRCDPAAKGTRNNVDAQSVQVSRRRRFTAVDTPIERTAVEQLMVVEQLAPWTDTDECSLDEFLNSVDFGSSIIAQNEFEADLEDNKRVFDNALTDVTVLHWPRRKTQHEFHVRKTMQGYDFFFRMQKSDDGKVLVYTDAGVRIEPLARALHNSTYAFRRNVVAQAAAMWAAFFSKGMYYIFDPNACFVQFDGPGSQLGRLRTLGITAQSVNNHERIPGATDNLFAPPSTTESGIHATYNIVALNYYILTGGCANPMLHHIFTHGADELLGNLVPTLETMMGADGDARTAMTLADDLACFTATLILELHWREGMCHGPHCAYCSNRMPELARDAL